MNWVVLKISGPTNFIRNQLFLIINNPIVGLPSLRNTQTISISFVILCIFATFFHCVPVTFWLEPNWPSCSARAVSMSFFFSFPAWGGWATCCLCCFIWVVRLEDKKSCCWKDFFDALRRAAFFGWCNMVSPCKTASFRRTYPLNQTIVLRCQQWCFHGPWHLLDSSFNRRCDVGTGSNISNCQPEIKHLHMGLEDSLLST